MTQATAPQKTSSETPMPDPSKPGHFCWMELMTPDREKAVRFYSELCGWEMDHRPMTAPCPDGEQSFTYTMAGPKGAPYKVAGMMQMDGPQWAGIPPHWMAYITVKDVDAKVEQVTKLGGQVKVPPTDIPDVGRFSVIQDPTGAVVSLITLKMKS